MNMQIARIYDVENIEGYRVLIDRLWPRGVSKEKANLDLWAKDIAPSTDLREWFGHEPERFVEFSHRYREELDNNPAMFAFIDELQAHSKVVLLYAAKDPKVNHARVLIEYLQQKLG
jgi:uncharacterized protein YeaO (DUF488 family)